MTIVFEEFDPVKGFAPIINEEPFKLDPAMPLELPGLIPSIPVPSIPGWPPKPKPLTLDPNPSGPVDPSIPDYNPDGPVPDITNPDDDNEPIFDPFRFEPWPDFGDPNYEYPDKWRTPMWTPIRIPF